MLFLVRMPQSVDDHLRVAVFRSFRRMRKIRVATAKTETLEMTDQFCCFVMRSNRMEKGYWGEEVANKLGRDRDKEQKRDNEFSRERSREAKMSHSEKKKWNRL